MSAHKVVLTWDGSLDYGPSIAITCPPDCETYVWTLDTSLVGNACHCAERGNGIQCEDCALGDHDSCGWGTYIYDLDASCRCLPNEKSCWYAHVANEMGGEQFSFNGSVEFEAELGGAGDETVTITKVEPS